MATSRCSHGSNTRYNHYIPTLSNHSVLQLNIVRILPHFCRIAAHDVSWAWKIAGCFIPISFVSTQRTYLMIDQVVDFGTGLGGRRCLSRCLYSSFFGWGGFRWALSILYCGRIPDEISSPGHNHISALGAVMVSLTTSKVDICVLNSR